MFTAEGTLRAPWRLAGFALVTFAALVFLGAIAREVTPATVNSAVVSTWIALLALVFAHAVMLRWVDRRPWRSVAMGADGAKAAPLAVGFVAGAVGILVAGAILLALGWVELVPLAGRWLDWGRFAGLMALYLAAPALVEEIAFRGYLFATLREWGGRWVALAITSILFGLLHWRNPGASAQPLVLVSLAGVFLGVVLLVTESLYAAWAAHLAWNWVLVGVMHADVSGLSPAPPPLYRAVDAGPDWATGGAWGPEGGAFAVLGMLCGVGVLFVRPRRRTGPS